ncbi:hypothetical protein [Agarivorans sp. JK6]|uniref:hypothetical protein n=1 Tax=Agarivorans sp. JK6 TaxID=2997426 RepID=UPI0038736ED1
MKKTVLLAAFTIQASDLSPQDEAQRVLDAVRAAGTNTATYMIEECEQGDGVITCAVYVPEIASNAKLRLTQGTSNDSITVQANGGGRIVLFEFLWKLKRYL